MRTTFAVLTLSLLAGCGHKVTVSWVAPAEVGLDADVEQVLVINRSVAGSTGETLLDLGEGLATGEGFDTDRETSEVAIEALLDVLEQTERFEVVDFRVDGERVDSSIWDGELDPRKIARLCDKAECDAIVALDALDTDTVATLARDREEKTFEATATTDLVATFRTYDADGAILDEARLRVDGGATAEGTRQEALAAVRVAPEVQVDLAAEVGAAYGRRIAPHLAHADRALYRSGDPALRAAIDHVKAGDWDGAAALWRGVIRDGSDKDAAKARHNLAVFHELEGDLERALGLARRADVELDRSRTHGYLLALEARVVEAERLAEQLPAVDAAWSAVVRS